MAKKGPMKIRSLIKSTRPQKTVKINIFKSPKINQGLATIQGVFIQDIAESW